MNEITNDALRWLWSALAWEHTLTGLRGSTEDTDAAPDDDTTLPRAA